MCMTVPPEGFFSLYRRLAGKPKTVLMLCAALGACGIEPDLPSGPPAAPFDLQVFPGDGSVTVRFRSVNTEDRFDGFNVHLAESAGVRTSGEGPLLNAGTEPTIPFSRHQVGPSGVWVERTFDRDRQDRPLRNGVSRFVAVRSRTSDGRYSDFSAEVRTTPRPQSAVPVTVSTGEGFSLAQGSHAPPWDFVLRAVTNTLLIEPQAGAVLFDAGAFPSARECNRVTNAAFLPPGTPMPVAVGRAYILRRSDNRHGKVYVRSLGVSTMTFDWAFQTVPGNPDI